MTRLHVVTGALGYSGRAVTERLLARGDRVRTLTNSTHKPNPFGPALDIRPLDFGHPAALTDSLRGADTLVNTYWVRFNHARRGFSHAQAVQNSIRLFHAARDAGLRRIVHVSILNPRDDLGLSYYTGKSELERELARLSAETGISHAVIRPGVLFGPSGHMPDILVNNIAWALRHLPVFGIFGSGAYGIRPMHIDDFADLIVAKVSEATTTTTDAVGPERFTYRDLIHTVRAAIRARGLIVHVPEPVGVLAARVLSPLVNDVILTRDEIRALCAGLLDSPAPTAATRPLTTYVRENAPTLGRRYASELARRR